VSEPPRYALDQTQQVPLPPRVEPKLSLHATGGHPPAPFPNSGGAAPSSTQPQVLPSPAPVVAGAPPVAPTLVATPAVVPVQQAPSAVDSVAAMKVVPPAEQLPVVQQVPNVNTNSAPVSRKLQQTAKGKLASCSADSKWQ
jgi:hypothetical protein